LIVQPEPISSAVPSTDTELILDRLTRLHPKSIDLTLGRTRRLLDKLGNPERRLAPVIHVAGTNGKGSVIAFLRAMLLAAGYKVQAYTSPHLVDFAERIRLVDGKIGAERLLTLLDECEQVNAGEPITFFEITTAAAFLAFSREAADVTLVEVGLGGRFDSTNVIAKPRLTAITPISHDHHAFLGNTLAKIAREKAGILKSGAPVVIARQPKQAREVVDAYAHEVGVPLVAHGLATRHHRAGFDWSVERRQSDFDLCFRGDRHALPQPVLRGDHQYDNAAQAVVCLSLLDEFQVNPEAISAGLQAASWPGRLQRIRPNAIDERLPDDAEIWFDGGHNPAAARALSATLKKWQISDPRPLFLIVGMIETKNPKAFLTPLSRLATAIATVPIPASPAGRSPQALAAIISKLGVPVVAANSVADALRGIAVGRSPFDGGKQAPRILITGSLYLASQVIGHKRGRSRLGRTGAYRPLL